MNWESLISSRMRPCSKMAAQDYEHSEGRKRQHRAWAKSAEGQLSYRRRQEKWRASEKGRETCRRKSLRFYDRHKNDPEFKAKRHDYERKFRLRHRPGKLRQIDFTITLLGGGTFTAHVLTTRRTAA